MFEKKIYKQRREKLIRKISGGVALLMGNTETPANFLQNPYPFRQDSSFLYFFGLDIPGLAGIIDFDSGDSYLFGNDAGIDDIIWMGPQVSLQENAEKVGVSITGTLTKMYDVILGCIRQGRQIHFLPPYRSENKIHLEKLLGISAIRLKEYASEALIKAIVEMRSVKESNEIEEIKKACATGYEMHVTAMKMAKPGVLEKQIAGTIEGIAVAGGGMVSFPVILSQNGQILHNHDHSQTLKEGRLMLTDAGAESVLHYASDFTRTIPVGGKFSQKQREIYGIVLAANNTAIENAKPGITFLDLHLSAAEVIVSGLKDVGLMKGDIKEAVKNGAHALFFPHGLGHMMGLDVHDMEDLGQDYVGFDDEIRPSKQFGLASLRLGRRLQEGFVVTIEPGIYFIPELIRQWQSKKLNTEFINYDKVNQYLDFGGIRLEDDILITKTGSEIIGNRVPIDPEEVKKIVSG